MATQKKPEEMIVTEEVTEVTPQSPSTKAEQKPSKSMEVANQHIWSDSDKEKLQNIGDSYEGMNTDQRIQAHKDAEAIRDKWGYSGGPDGSEYKPKDPMRGYLDAWRGAAEEQAKKQADFAVQQGVTELERANADAQEKFDTQLAQNEKAERKALDNHALYMEARGDRGGIGHAQYGEIQAQALRNEQTINSNRVKLATDTQRKIADLRAQGEFQKADKLLGISQQFLQQLFALEQWNKEFAFNREQFEESVRQWEKDFDLSVGQVMGQYQGKPTFQAHQADLDRLMSTGMTLLQSGIMPTDAQLSALGYTKDQAKQMLNEYRLQQQLKVASSRGHSSRGGSSGGGGGGGSTEASTSNSNGYNMYQKAYADGVRSQADADAYFSALGYKGTRLKDVVRNFMESKMDLEDWWDQERANQKKATDTIRNKKNAEDAKKSAVNKKAWNGDFTGVSYDKKSDTYTWAGVKYKDAEEMVQDIDFLYETGKIPEMAYHILNSKLAGLLK